MKRWKRRMADRLGRALGVEIIPSANAPYWPERRFMAEVFARLGIDCVFDVGANQGQYGEDLRAAGFEGTILSFEPNPAAFARLDETAARDARWHAFPLALGRDAGSARFNIMKSDIFSSFRRPLAGDGVEFTDANVVAHAVEVKVERLDALLPDLRARFGFRRPFLKMDTQGFDLEVFAGAGDAARLFCGLVGEVSARPLYADAPTMAESLDAYRAKGFVMAALHSVHPTLPLKAIEFNCYCVRDDLAEADRPDFRAG